MSSRITDKIKADEILNRIINTFDNEVYLVGGAVRDFYMGKDTLDRDIIVIDEDAKVFAQKLVDLFEATFVILDDENKIYRVVLPDKKNYIDITNPVDNSLERDLLRRDLTINAIAVNLKSYEIIDLCGGIADIENKNINLISEHNFLDDPLRLLRVYRFQALLGFDISPDTLTVLCKYSGLISKSAVERISYELLKLFSGDYTDIALLNMDKVWLLEEIFPIVKELKQVPPNTHHHLDLFHHSIETVKQVNLLYQNSDDIVKSHLESVDFGGFNRLTHLKIAAFLHDIGKFSTWTVEKDTGRHRFMKHDETGAKMAYKILKKLNFSKKQIEYISLMIRNHIYPSQVMAAPEITDKIMMRFVRRTMDNSIDNIILAQADRLSARGPFITDEIIEKNLSSLNRLMQFYKDVKDTLEPLPKLLSGNDVMDILNIKPSPELGKIMDALYDAQISGNINTKDEAMDFIKKFHAD